MDDAAPLILTAALDRASFDRFQGLRRAHFPPRLNVIDAHLSVFHHLPGAEMPRIVSDIQSVLAGKTVLRFKVDAPRSLGRGIAYDVICPRLDALVRRLASAWRPWLTPQDLQPFRAHVTIQNKVAPSDVRTLLVQLTAEFAAWEGRIEAFELWHYRGGPWQFERRFPFESENSR